MELEFKSVKELFEFIEELGYVKKEEKQEQKEENKTDKIDWTITKAPTCPYGFLNCPYNKSVTPYYPTLTTPYCDTDVGASHNTEWTTTSSSSGNETITVNMKDISQGETKTNNDEK